jgi:hypothetical protein
MMATNARSGALALAACLLGAACSSTTPPPHGAPVLTQVYWIAAGTPQLVYSRASDTNLVTSVQAFASEVDFVFDRRLDGDRIEDTITVDGAVMTVPKTTMPAIEAKWPDMEARLGDPPFKLQVAYNSASRFGDQSSYVFARPALPGFPSGETITFTLHTDQLTSAYGEPADALEKIPVKTAPFSVVINATAASVAARFELPLVFSNRLPQPPGASPFIHVTTRGADVPYKLLADASVGSRWYLAPADCLGAWPAGATLDVAVDVGLTDAFGGKLAEAATGSFTTSAAASTTTDASCSVADAGSEGDAPEGGAPEGGVTEGGLGDAAPDGGLGDAVDAPSSEDAVADAAEAG